MTKVHLTGHMDVPDDRLEAVTLAVADHIALTRTEAGCISFEVTPCPDVKGRFLVAETFQDRTAFDAHQTRANASPWAQITAGLPRDYTVTEEGK
ncbi:MAG: antibiotic biosynthesis monooxygenase [Rhodobacterales bacterium]